MSACAEVSYVTLTGVIRDTKTQLTHRFPMGTLTRFPARAYVASRKEPWPYVMLSRERSRVILQRIMSGPRPGVTLAVWEGARSYAEYDTGEIKATREELAELAGTNV